MNQITHTMQCSGKEYLALAKLHEAFSVVVQRIYRTSFLKTNGFCFYEGFIHEDVLFSSLVCAAVKQVIVTPEVFYVYRRRNGSILTKAGQSEKHAMSMAVVGNELFRFHDEHSTAGISEFNKRAVASAYRRAYQYSDSTTVDKKVKNVIVRKFFRKSSMVSLKHYLVYCIIEIRPALYRKIFKN